MFTEATTNVTVATTDGKLITLHQGDQFAYVGLERFSNSDPVHQELYLPQAGNFYENRIDVLKNIDTGDIIKLATPVVDAFMVAAAETPEYRNYQNEVAALALANN
ncbi:hypothetical protein [Lacticaseibacillus sharpeae]|uniref:Uncharacterized protein n=1 Tax=Lacticaseibacillus sharpeae JCM 1186 = DSM 20505 TaxID=1291052 RepID=A0A0R1ZNM6_9LACO|nr:hypothetical protein [Lacticaseibacillus sharpeae]KRM56672.1 hypothetical protein FC18_GL001806 [Lacticaseibacillus sharpeae JCM 1186 = DSM 20505]